MKRHAEFWATAVLTGAILLGTGCRLAVTAPIRAEQRDKAETGFDRLATLTPEEIAEFLDHRIEGKLELTDEQRPRVSAINLAHAFQLRAIAASNDSVRAKMRATKEENDAYEASLKDVLTGEQFTHFLALKDEMREALQELRSDK